MSFSTCVLGEEDFFPVYQSLISFSSFFNRNGSNIRVLNHNVIRCNAIFVDICIVFRNKTNLTTKIRL